MINYGQLFIAGIGPIEPSPPYVVNILDGQRRSGLSGLPHHVTSAFYSRTEQTSDCMTRQ